MVSCCKTVTAAFLTMSFFINKVVFFYCVWSGVMSVLCEHGVGIGYKATTRKKGRKKKVMQDDFQLKGPQ